ncbi:MAG TPA: DUF2621 family protein [Pseudobacteroides sp.]|nr:DUF2621 family protein [Pseudobacteroides sp.]
MRISISSQWDNDFLDICSKYGVSEIYNSLRIDPIGSIRPAACLPDSDISFAKDHIKRIHSFGMEFNYVMNSPCLGNIEFTKDGRQRIIEFLEVINDLGADIITVAVPYLIEIIKREFPNIKIKVSEVANVGTAQRAKYYDSMGIDLITIELTQNRNFQVLESMRKAVRPEVILEVIVNAACILHCPYHDYHNNMVCHTTQEQHFLHGYYMDYCMMRCIPKKLISPEEIIKAPWIRPEDIGVYEEIGINSFKISNRVGPGAIGKNCLEAFTQRKWDNIADLLTPLSLEIEEPKSSKLENFSQQEWDQMVKIWGIKSPGVFIDNSKLDGFIDYFRKNKCFAQCDSDCNYCSKIAEKAVKISNSNGELSSYINMIEQLIEPLMNLNRSANIESEKTISMMWDLKVKDTFDRLMQNTPEMFRDVAIKTISKLAETKAKERSSKVVQIDDVVYALLEGTPDLFKDDMIKSLSNEGINLSQYK